MVSISNCIQRPLLYNKSNKLQDAHPTRASLWCRGIYTIKHWCSSQSQSWEYARKKFYIRSSVQCKLAMISVCHSTMRYMCSSTLALTCHSNGEICSGETSICCGNLRKSAKSMTLFELLGPYRGSPVINWWDQLANTREKQKRLEVIGLLLAK